MDTEHWTGEPGTVAWRNEKMLEAIKLRLDEAVRRGMTGSITVNFKAGQIRTVDTRMIEDQLTLDTISGDMVSI